MKTGKLSLCALLVAAGVGHAGMGGAADLTIMAPAAPGSGWDHLARTLASALVAPVGGPSVEVINVPGASGLVGLAEFLASGGEGRFLVTGETMLAATLVTRAPAPLEALTPIARLSAEYFVLVVPAGSAIKSTDELVKSIQSEPGKASLAGGPVGSLDHVAAALFARAVNVDPQRLNYVPFVGSADAANAVGEGRVAAAILPLGEIRGEIGSGHLRVLGVTAGRRLPDLEAPSLTEAGVNLDFFNWRGVVGRPGLEGEERSRIASLLRQAMATPIWQEALAKRGWHSAYLESERFAEFLVAERTRLKEALRSVAMLRGGAKDR